MNTPFVLFSEKLLYALADSGKRYFVRQALADEKEAAGSGKGCFLFTHYGNRDGAEAHFRALERDIYRKLYDWNDPQDREKLLIAARRPAGYHIYAALFHPQWQKSFPKPFVQKLRTYIRYKLGWNPGRDEIVQPAIFLRFGRLYTRLRFKSQEVNVTLEEIENHS